MLILLVSITFIVLDCYISQLFNVTYVLLIDIALYLGLMLLLRYFRLKRTAAEDANAN